MKLKIRSVLYSLVILFSLTQGTFCFAQEQASATKESVRLLQSGQEFNSYAVDISMLPGFFEKAYLLDLLFHEPTVLIDHTDISGANLEVRSGLENSSIEMISLLSGYLTRAMKAGSVISPLEKEALVKKYDKYR